MFTNYDIANLIVSKCNAIDEVYDKDPDQCSCAYNDKLIPIPEPSDKDVNIHVVQTNDRIVYRFYIMRRCSLRVEKIFDIGNQYTYLSRLCILDNYDGVTTKLLPIINLVSGWNFHELVKCPDRVYPHALTDYSLSMLLKCLSVDTEINRPSTLVNNNLW